MADHKNQHYTPRCVLKPFSLNGSGKAINLYVFGRDKLIQNAPTKNQCARDYLYGSDGKIEESLAKFESMYAQALLKVQNREDSESDRDVLKAFSHLQLRRTEMAINRMAALEQNVFKEVFGDQEPEHPSSKYYMLQSLKICLDTQSKLEDLKVRIIENRTAVDFVIGDDPAVLANKFSAQRLGESSFGINSSGLLLVMPLTPRLAVISYDGQVYTAPALESDRIILKKSSDADAINELQFLKATASIYFSNWDSRASIQEKFVSAKPGRLDTPTKFIWLRYDGKGQDGDIFVECTKEEAAQPGVRSMIHQSSEYPIPSAWVSQLTYRRPTKTFFNGTAAGHVRKEEWLKKA